MSTARGIVLLLLALGAAMPAEAQHQGHAPPAAEPEPASATQQNAPASASPAGSAPRESLPPVTDADRAAAFPQVHAHHAHGTSIHSYWLLDRLELSDADAGGTRLAWEGTAWVGGDVQKLWLRSEGERTRHSLEHADVEVLYGRGISAWWDVVAGVRRDFGHGPRRSWLAAGVQGLAPGKFEVSATAYLGEGGRTALAAEAEYDTLLSNRLILQWLAGASAHGRDDPRAMIGSGLSDVHAGLRLRYEIHRQFAPYVGIEHMRSFGQTARLRDAAGEPARQTQWVAGLRIWW